MDFGHKKRLFLTGVALLGLPMAFSPTVYAAKVINLKHQNISVLRSITAPDVKVEEVSRDVDFKKTLHVRLQQTFNGYSVMGGEGIMHIPHGENIPSALNSLTAAVQNGGGFMNGRMYADIKTDLANTPASVFNQAQAQRLTQQAIDTYQGKVGKSEIKNKQASLIVYMDSDNKAHWAYKISFHAAAVKENERASQPVFILDAMTGQSYGDWDEVKSLNTTPALDIPGGGFGGNLKMGKLVYDGLQGNLAQLMLRRTDSSGTCHLKNNDVVVRDFNSDAVMKFHCANTDSGHNNLYWSADFDAVNGGYSPANDALFGGIVIKHMYKDWYGVPVLTKNGNGKTPIPLIMVVHERFYDNAYWDGEKMTFGDGYSYFYPLTSLGVAAHEISHGFTEQHANLTYQHQSGGMNESFSDMAAQAAEFYAYGKNSWQIGPEIFKAQNEALRYMDVPSKDCGGKKPGNWCSIDDATQYTKSLDVHYSSGVYNRFFYTLGTTTGWDTKKAFDVMVHANSHYWTPNTTFSEGACGVLYAAKDLGYDQQAILDAFAVVKVDTSNC